MIKKLNNFINSSILVSILFILLGIIMILFPKTSLTIFAYLIAILLIINGIYLIILDSRMRNLFIPIDTFLSGILSTLLGIIQIIYPNTLKIIIPITLGTYFIASSIVKMRLALSLKEFGNSSWMLTLILAILSIICGIILILNPTITSITITLFSGIMMIIYAISDIIDMVLFKKHIKEINKHFQKQIKIIDE